MRRRNMRLWQSHVDQRSAGTSLRAGAGEGYDRAAATVTEQAPGARDRLAGGGWPTPARRSACHIIAEALEITGLPRSCSSASRTETVGMPVPLRKTPSAS